jgi:NitT/TauT family transport system substrate-binding protein
MIFSQDFIGNAPPTVGRITHSAISPSRAQGQAPAQPHHSWRAGCFFQLERRGRAGGPCRDASFKAPCPKTKQDAMLGRSVMVLARSALLCALGGMIAAGPAQALEKLTFQLSWKAQAEQGAYYQALAKGFYGDCGLDVVIRQGGPGIDNMQLLVGGAIDATLTSQTDGVFHMNAAGFPARALFAGYQRTPQILMTHADNGINSFEDMKGKPIAISAGSRSTFWPFLKAKFGFTDAQIRSYSGQLAGFINDKNMIQQAIITNEPYILKKEAGIESKNFLLADLGYNAYGSIITVSQAVIDKKPDAVRCLVQASQRGWDDYFKDPKVGFEMVKKEEPSNTDDLMAYSLKALSDFKIAISDDTAKSGFGAMSEARWKAHFDMMVEQGLIKPDLDWRSVFTTEFMTKRIN